MQKVTRIFVGYAREVSLFRNVDIMASGAHEVYPPGKTIPYSYGDCFIPRSDKTSNKLFKLLPAVQDYKIDCAGLQTERKIRSFMVWRPERSDEILE